MNVSPKVLDGVRILELARWQAAPRGGLVLRDMGAEVIRIENFISTAKGDDFDKMLLKEYSTLDQNIFDVNIKPESIKYIDEIFLSEKLITDPRNFLRSFIPL